ncbi:MAG: DUF494 family protein [Candidatus Hydrogenedentota bacterium]
MKHTLIELADVIIERLEQRPEALPTENGLRSWLSRLGYTKRDIDQVIKLVRPRVEALRHAGIQRPGAVRHLSVYEEYKLTPAAREALARLELYNLVDAYEREMILDRLNQFEGDVGLDELDYLLSWLLYSTRDVESQQTLFNVFEGHTQVH